MHFHSMLWVRMNPFAAYHGGVMKRLFDFGTRYARQSTWKDFALVKLCLFSMGLASGTMVKKEHRKAVICTASAGFALSYIPLMTKVFRLAFRKDK